LQCEPLHALLWTEQVQDASDRQSELGSFQSENSSGGPVQCRGLLLWLIPKSDSSQRRRHPEASDTKASPLAQELADSGCSRSDVLSLPPTSLHQSTYDAVQHLQKSFSTQSSMDEALLEQR
jgi:hypothetical protein